MQVITLQKPYKVDLMSIFVLEFCWDFNLGFWQSDKSEKSEDYKKYVLWFLCSVQLRQEVGK